MIQTEMEIHPIILENSNGFSIPKVGVNLFKTLEDVKGDIKWSMFLV